MINSLKRLLRPFYGPIVDSVRHRRLRGPRAMLAFARIYPRATFVQIGSNDGEKHDPLRAAMLRAHWRGIMVEPVPYVFERLRQRYGDREGVTLEPVAVAASGGALPFYHLRPAAPGESLPDWYDELGSFRRDVVMKHTYAIPDLEQRLVTTQVRCVTFAELCGRNGISAVDLLHIDTEGYDYEILKSIDFSRFRPLLLIYEHKHLGPVRAACRKQLEELGYHVFEEHSDTWCADTRVRDEAHRRWLNIWQRLAAGTAP